MESGLEGILAGIVASHPWLASATLIVHLLCVAMVIGSVTVFDLRLLGFWRFVGIRDMHRVLIPLALLFTLPAAASGAALFALHADLLVGSGAFVLKMLALFGAAINAMIFVTGPWQSEKTWPLERAPVGARLCAIVSIVFLATIVACGALLANQIARL